MPFGHTPSCQPEIETSLAKETVNFFATIVNESQDKQEQVHRDVVPSETLCADDAGGWDQDQFEETPHGSQVYDSIEDTLSIIENSSDAGLNTADTSLNTTDTGIPTIAANTVIDQCNVKVVQLKSSQNLTPDEAEEDGDSRLASDYSKCPVSQLRSMCSQRGIRLVRNAKKVQMLQALRENDTCSSPS